MMHAAARAARRAGRGAAGVARSAVRAAAHRARRAVVARAAARISSARGSAPFPALFWAPWAGVLVAACLWLASLPHPLFADPYSLVVTDRNGELLGATIADDGQWRFPPTDELPQKYVRAVIRFEDRRFYRHPGVDPLAIARALGENARAGDVVSGGSTITMQVIRLARKNRPRTLLEKGIEAALAVRLELATSKADVMRLFASHAPFGGNVVGLEAAAWRYFGRSPESLSWAEAALLAVLPNSPGMMHPGRNREALAAKRNELLAELREQGAFDDDTLRLAQGEPLPAAPVPIPRLAPQLVDSVRSGAYDGELAGSARPADGSAFGSSARTARVRTTLSRELQIQATALLARRSAALESVGVHNAAALILDVKSGDALAYVGNLPSSADAPDGERSGDGRSVDIIRAPRSTGSLLKPFLFAAMNDSGELLPTQLVADIPTRMGGYMPQNFNRSYLGAVPAREALARSLNVPAARLLRSYGVDRFYSLLKAHGMNSLTRSASDYGIALILGGAEGSLWELTGMYAGMARAATGSPGARAFFAPRAVYHDERAAPPPDAVASTLSPAAWWVTLDALLEVRRPEEEGAWRDYLSSQPISWKTGTSYGYRDAWAIGVTPKYAVGVWVGNASGEGRPDLRGLAAAAPILFELFNLLGPLPPFPVPKDAVSVSICPQSGFLAGPYCPERETMLAAPGAMNAAVDPYHRLVHLDETERYQVDAGDESIDRIRTVSRFVLPPVMEWYYVRSGASYRPLPPFRRDATSRADLPFSVLFPEQGSTIYIPIDYGGQAGSVVFEVIHRRADALVYWHLDGRYLGATRRTHQWELRPSRGAHELVVVDDLGNRAVRQFEVISD